MHFKVRIEGPYFQYLPRDTVTDYVGASKLSYEETKEFLKRILKAAMSFGDGLVNPEGYMGAAAINLLAAGAEKILDDIDDESLQVLFWNNSNIYIEVEPILDALTEEAILAMSPYDQAVLIRKNLKTLLEQAEGTGPLNVPLLQAQVHSMEILIYDLEGDHDMPAGSRSVWVEDEDAPRQGVFSDPPTRQTVNVTEAGEILDAEFQEPEEECCVPAAPAEVSDPKEEVGGGDGWGAAE